MKYSMFLLSIFFCTVLSAQSLHIGGKAAASLGKIDGVSFEDGYQLGYQLGAFAEIDINKTVGIQPEVLFNQTNSQYSDEFKDIYENILNPAGEDGVKLNYLSIPVLLRINASEKFTILAGPQFSILLDDTQNLVDNGQQAFKSGDVNGVAGFQLNWGSFRVFGRYVFGLSDINNIDDQDTWKNNQIQTGVGITLF
jgi:hypothetical protein